MTKKNNKKQGSKHGMFKINPGRQSHVPLISVDAKVEGIAGEEEYYSQQGEPLTPAEFVEAFSTTVFMNLLVLRTIGIPRKEINAHLDADGCFMISPNYKVATGIPSLQPITAPLRGAIIRSVRRLTDDWEHNRLDPEALKAAKQYFCFDQNLREVRKSMVSYGVKLETSAKNK